MHIGLLYHEKLSFKSEEKLGMVAHGRLRQEDCCESPKALEYRDPIFFLKGDSPRTLLDTLFHSPLSLSQ